MEKKNIMFLIGNGFDIGALSALGAPHLTTYSQFYKYLSFYCLNSNNEIYKALFESKTVVRDFWGKDFEEILYEIFRNKAATASVNYPDIDATTLQADYEEIQTLFLNFVNTVVLPEHLMTIYGKGINEIKSYLKDFPKYSKKNININDVDFAYNIFNFNYTTLVDNYFINDNSIDVNNLSIIHPHGTYYVPKSILFGVTDAEKGHPENYPGGGNHQRQRKRERNITKVVETIDKSIHYKNCEEIIKTTNTFVIFGHSIGNSDKWWWEKIAEQVNNGSDLLLYWFDNDISNQSDKEKELKKLFFENLSDYKELSDEDKDIFYNGIEICFFNEKNPLDNLFNFKDIKLLNK